MPLLKVKADCIIGTEAIVTADYYDGSPIVRGAEGPPPPSPESATLTITLSGKQEIELRGREALKVWRQLEKMAAASIDQ